jgi:plastocyanin
MVVQPCAAAADYVEGVNTVTFPNDDASYKPKCLKVAPGDTVTFMAGEGTFAMHPLEAARRRGDTTNNPITTTMGAMTSREFTFTFSGFYGYYCGMHGADDGSVEAGVIWVH